MEVLRRCAGVFLLWTAGCTHETQLVVRADWRDPQDLQHVSAEMHQVWRR
jgi:hypothetical protein